MQLVQLLLNRHITKNRESSHRIIAIYARWQQMLSASQLVNDAASGNAGRAYRHFGWRCALPVSLIWE